MNEKEGRWKKENTELRVKREREREGYRETGCLDLPTSVVSVALGK